MAIFNQDHQTVGVQMNVAHIHDDSLLREIIYDDITAERDRQDAKWGSQRGQSGYLWNAILTEEVGEAAKEVLEHDAVKLREELVQVAAVVVAWLEALDAGR